MSEPSVESLWGRLGNVGQAVSLFLVATLLALWVVYGTVAAHRSEERVRTSIRHEIQIHAEASADRQCAVAKELRFIVFRLAYRELEPDDLRKIGQLVTQACELVDIPNGEGAS